MLLGMTKYASSHPRKTYPTLRWLMSAAAPLLEEVIAKTRAMFGREVLRNGFGMSELVATAIATLPGGKWLEVSGYRLTWLMVRSALATEPLTEGLAGRLNPNVEAKIIDHHRGTDAGFNDPGELYLRGPQVVREFFDTGLMLDKEGWLHTGDVASVDEEGVFTIRDRIKVCLLDWIEELVPANGRG
jgi:acyl-CoA synthetase (AMP-forming)/AMP-acid ligase II